MRMVTVIAADDQQTASTTIALPHHDLALRDRRLAPGIPATAHLVYQRLNQTLHAGGSIDLGIAYLDHYRICDSVASLLQLYQALNPAAGIGEFAFLASWPELAPAAKRELYGTYVCHELNLFLARKDPGFFAAVVAPHLRNKLQKGFIDHWLLGDDLGSYLEVDRHAHLNLLERILLAQRLPDHAEELAHIDDLVAAAVDGGSDSRFAELNAQALTGKLEESGENPLRKLALKDAPPVPAAAAPNAVMKDKADAQKEAAETDLNQDINGAAAADQQPQYFRNVGLT
jgi:hypothetical protein